MGDDLMFIASAKFNQRVMIAEWGTFQGEFLTLF
tara:strand:+ start:149 stop:250 length:102 start_codon:yes stop_codon:yes gene_type:complete